MRCLLIKNGRSKELLDKVSPDNPVVLSRADGHSVLVNSYVLKASGITKNTPDPFGGEIQKDPVTGEPTGILKENAEGLVKTGEIKTERTPEEEAARDMAGISSCTERSTGTWSYKCSDPGKC